jgi:hypothetical protein
MNIIISLPKKNFFSASSVAERSRRRRSIFLCSATPPVPVRVTCRALALQINKAIFQTCRSPPSMAASSVTLKRQDQAQVRAGRFQRSRSSPCRPSSPPGRPSFRVGACLAARRALSGAGGQDRGEPRHQAAGRGPRGAPHQVRPPRAARRSAEAAAQAVHWRGDLQPGGGHFGGIAQGRSAIRMADERAPPGANGCARQVNKSATPGSFQARENVTAFLQAWCARRCRGGAGRAHAQRAARRWARRRSSRPTTLWRERIPSAIDRCAVLARGVPVSSRPGRRRVVDCLLWVAKKAGERGVKPPAAAAAAAETKGAAKARCARGVHRGAVDESERVRESCAQRRVHDGASDEGPRRRDR